MAARRREAAVAIGSSRAREAKAQRGEDRDAPRESSSLARRKLVISVLAASSTRRGSRSSKISAKMKSAARTWLRFVALLAVHRARCKVCIECAARCASSALREVHRPAALDIVGMPSSETPRNASPCAFTARSGERHVQFRRDAGPGVRGRPQRVYEPKAGIAPQRDRRAWSPEKGAAAVRGEPTGWFNFAEILCRAPRGSLRLQRASLPRRCVRWWPSTPSASRCVPRRARPLARGERGTLDAPCRYWRIGVTLNDRSAVPLRRRRCR